VKNLESALSGKKRAQERVFGCGFKNRNLSGSSDSIFFAAPVARAVKPGVGHSCVQQNPPPDAPVTAGAPWLLSLRASLQEEFSRKTKLKKQEEASA
jgi:hypothetical protein